MAATCPTKNGARNTCGLYTIGKGTACITPRKEEKGVKSQGWYEEGKGFEPNPPSGKAPQPTLDVQPTRIERELALRKILRKELHGLPPQLFLGLFFELCPSRSCERTRADRQECNHPFHKADASIGLNAGRRRLMSDAVGYGPHDMLPPDVTSAVSLLLKLLRVVPAELLCAHL